RENLCGSLERGEQGPRRFQDHAGRLRARHPGSHRIAPSKGALSGHAPGEMGILWQAHPPGYLAGFVSAPEIRRFPRRVARANAVPIHMTKWQGGSMNLSQTQTTPRILASRNSRHKLERH